jgi:hypothetical protein
VDRDDGLQAGVLVVAEDDFFVTRVGDGFKDHWNGDSMIMVPVGIYRWAAEGTAGIRQRLMKTLETHRPDRGRGDGSKDQV